ncbi:hypothetical protein AGMMS49982_21180 [Bacteroidia bacterium]|nr:hypothetical protein AGMMS49982_21180 [Bacteroidia bacterium]
MIRASVKPAVFYTANVLLFINIIMSGSRSAFVGLLFFSFFAFFSYFSWKKILVIGIGILAFLAIPKSFPGIGAAADTMKAFVFVWDDSASKDIEAGGSSFEARQEQLTRSFEIASAFTSPLVGVGSGYLENFADTSTLITNDLLGLESILFGMLIEQGILGVLFYFFLFFQLYFFTKRLQKQAGIKNYMPEMYYFSYCVGIIMTGVRSNYDIFFVFALIYIKYLYFQSQISR